MNQNEIWQVNLDPTIGAEIKKIRPVVIVNDNALGKLPLKVIIPITDWKENNYLDKNRIKETKYLLEKPLKADFALIFAQKADKYGNLVYHGAAQNFNSVMAGAATKTIVEVLEYSEEALNPDIAETPGVFVNYIVKGTR